MMSYGGKVNIKPIKKVAISDLSVEKIKEFLESGEIKIGEKLPTEKDFCEMLGVSRSTVREALRILQATGYVDMRPGLGAFLLRDQAPDPNEELIDWFSEHECEIEDYIQVRMAIEPLAARLAVRKATEEDLYIIDQCRIAYETSLERAESEQLGIHDAAFHRAIIEASHNPLLVKINILIQGSFAEFRKATFQVQRNAINAIAPHRQILSAIQKRDPEEAEQTMIAHLVRVLDDMEFIVRKKN